MPQIRCPKCGTTVNLENRRNNDFNLILKSVKNKERSFSELLKITKLPRKTLNLRLKQLLMENKLIKNEKGLYCANDGGGGILDKEIQWPANKKLLSLLILCLCLPTISFALAMMIQPTIEPQPLGRFIIKVGVKDVSDVYGWQIGLRFDSTKLKVVSVSPGDFFENPTQCDNLLSKDITDLGNTLFITKVYNGTIVICQTLKGDSPPKSGSGTLAIIEFQFYSSDYEKPELIFDDPAYGTALGRKDATEIPIDRNSISIEFEILQ